MIEHKRLRVSKPRPSSKHKWDSKTWTNYIWSDDWHRYLVRVRRDCSYFHQPRFDYTNTKWAPRGARPHLE